MQQQSAVLVIFTSSLHMYSEIGPFCSVKLIVYEEGSWQLQCDMLTILWLTLLNFGVEEIEALAATWLSTCHTLCPGIMKTAHDAGEKLSYIGK